VEKEGEGEIAAKEGLEGEEPVNKEETERDTGAELEEGGAKLEDEEKSVEAEERGGKVKECDEEEDASGMEAKGSELEELERPTGRKEAMEEKEEKVDVAEVAREGEVKTDEKG